MEGSSQAKAGKALEVQFEMDTDSKSVPSPMKQIRCTNCAASMEQNQSKCEYCGTNYKVRKPAEPHHELDDLRDETGRQLFYKGEPISRRDYREKQREIFQAAMTQALANEVNRMSPNEIIGLGEEMPEVTWSFKEGIFVLSLVIALLILFYLKL